MSDADRKLLTEEVLGECWHDSVYTDHRGSICLKCDEATFLGNQRTFTTWQDLGDIKGKLVEKGMWNDFSAFAWDKWTDQCEDEECPIEDHANWLLNPTRFCRLVADWWKEEHHGQEP